MLLNREHSWRLEGHLLGYRAWVTCLTRCLRPPAPPPLPSRPGMCVTPSRAVVDQRSCVFDGIEDMPTSSNILKTGGGDPRAVGAGAPKGSLVLAQRGSGGPRGHGPSPRVSSATLPAVAGGSRRGRSQSMSTHAEPTAVVAALNEGSGSHHRAYPHPLRRGVSSVGGGLVMGAGGAGKSTHSASPSLLGVGKSPPLLHPQPPPQAVGNSAALGPASGPASRCGSYQLFPHPGPAQSPPPPPPPHHLQNHQLHMQAQGAVWSVPQGVVTPGKRDGAVGMVDNEVQARDGLHAGFEATGKAPVCALPSRGSAGGGGGGFQAFYEGGRGWPGENGGGRSGGTGAVAYGGAHGVGASPEEPSGYRRANSSIPAGFQCTSYMVNPECDGGMGVTTAFGAGIGAADEGSALKYRGGYIRGDYHVEAAPRLRDVHHGGMSGSLDVARPHSFPGIPARGIPSRGSGRAAGYGW